MDVLYSSDDGYAHLMGISILSLLENNKSVERIRIFIIDNRISQENKDKLLEVARRYSRELSFVPMPDVQELAGRPLKLPRRWDVSTFGRLFAAGILPEVVRKVVYIDCDTIVLDSLMPLWDADMSGKVVGGVLECINNRYRRNVGMQDGDYYFNAGVVVLNLVEIRALGYEKLFVDYVKKYGSSLAYLDQDVINSTVSQALKMLLPMRYNVLAHCFYVSYRQLLRMRLSKHFYSQIEFEEARRSPAIVHFTTSYLDGLRPWIEGNRHPYRGEFLKYKAASPWADMPLQADTRKYIVKLRSKVIRYMPKALLLPVVAFLHGVVLPTRNKIRMNRAKDEINEHTNV